MKNPMVKFRIADDDDDDGAAETRLLDEPVTDSAHSADVDTSRV